MTDIFLRPDLKTAGGEVCDIMYKDRYAGTMTLVYREKDRICGSVQLERESLSSKEKKAVVRFVKRHIQATIDALKASECDVLVTHSTFDHVIATNDAFLEAEDEAAIYDDETEVYWVNDGSRFEDFDTGEQETFEMHKGKGKSKDKRGGSPLSDEPVAGDDSNYRNPVYYELVATKESKNKMEYHVYDKEQEWIAEVFMRIVGNDVIGDIHWMFSPLDEEIEHVTDLVVSDFDPDSIDTFTIDHRYEGEIIETFELAHEDLYDEDMRGDLLGTDQDMEDYTVVLARDDQDMLTYEIYDQKHGGLPIGTATVDISQRQLSGFIDFRSQIEQPGTREKIASLIMQELDKEKDYSMISFTMLCNNKPIDEIVFENEPVH